MSNDHDFASAIKSGDIQRVQQILAQRRGMTIEELVALYQPADSVPPLSSLSGLDRVDWSAVQDAFGPATNVPALFRALTSGEPEHRTYAIHALCQHICHQGTVYSATALAVPILYDLLVGDGPHDKSQVAELLATIADGRPPFFQCADDPQQAAKWRSILGNAGRSLEAEMEEGRRYAAEIRRQLAERLDLLSPYLGDADPGVRHSVAVALGRFPEMADRLLPELNAARRDESDEYVREAVGEAIDGLTERCA